MTKKENAKVTVKERKSATRASLKRSGVATVKTPPEKMKPNMEKGVETAEVPVTDHVTLFSDYDIHLFKEGKHYELYTKLGSHVIEYKGVKGTYFAVWAPNAERVSVIGDFNCWARNKHPMNVRYDGSGIWESFIPGIGEGTVYKYFIESRHGAYKVEKGDPFAFKWEIPPNTASIVWDIASTWGDTAWMERRKENTGKPQAFSVYEMHFGSWRRVPEDNNRSLSYREMAAELPAYVKKMGFTHVEFMPVMEHPFFGSWGYQVTGYFAPSSRFGSPQDFIYLIDSLHQEGIGVILDWVPSHFPSDQHGLHYFDGTFLFEHADPRKGYHPDWKSYIFNYGRNEVRAFLISNAMYWLDVYHADGLRVDAVASMLYLDYSRNDGEWEPNPYGGNENLEAISFLKEFNEAVYARFPDVQTIAEESTSWPMVSKPTYVGGLGFGMKWMMGWMHDTLEYFKKDPIHRQHHQNEITFSAYYMFTENFMLPLSHDEVVYYKNALLYKMPGDEWQRFANLRALYGYMYAHPGAKLLFMGGEFGQTSEWSHDQSLDWHLTEYPLHQGVQKELMALNQLYKTERSLYEISFDEAGFEWIDIHDDANSVISFVRKGKSDTELILVMCNFTPIPRENYRVGVPKEGQWKEIFNSDDQAYGGSHVKNIGVITSEPFQSHGHDNSIVLTLPPLGVVYLKYGE
ncbi:1,4-alpha-glucan branching protein GlgB [Fulvivirga sp. 29W222]|uniref:1,4-alpha-glucan branching enzyme GlgB n=1 Tax=Fulvivirga marina TaxID=2494733 RepID=A0A937FWR7_9BACT|nr:1,4-alpha-glucan branching protein GlgB [Fulvivirga marina]MBL6447474.1 1,4-alpha-glucan branching protein GlgB [Fulvivirga marina]